MSADEHRRWPHPIFLDLSGQPVVVVGGGAVAERKIETLIAASARISVVSPEVTPAIAAWGADGRLSIALRPYRRGDLAGVRLAYAATSDMAVNQAIRDEARAEGVWLNAVDRPALCDFISPATVRRGDLTLAVSTNGRAPALAKQIRQDLEHAYGQSTPGWSMRWVKLATAPGRNPCQAGPDSTVRPAWCTWSARDPATSN